MLSHQGKNRPTRSLTKIVLLSQSHSEPKDPKSYQLANRSKSSTSSPNAKEQGKGKPQGLFVKPIHSGEWLL